MTNEKLNREQLQMLLVLNYDTNAKEVLTLTERCLIHKAIHRNDTYQLDRSVKNKVNEVLLKIKVNNYKPIFFEWLENIDKGGFAPKKKDLQTEWNYLK
ncbi:MAG: hypothetical protein ACRC8Z_16525 [Empedobacter falsenii]